MVHVRTEKNLLLLPKKEQQRFENQNVNRKEPTYQTLKCQIPSCLGKPQMQPHVYYRHYHLIILIKHQRHAALQGRGEVGLREKFAQRLSVPGPRPLLCAAGCLSFPNPDRRGKISSLKILKHFSDQGKSALLGVRASD